LLFACCERTPDLTAEVIRFTEFGTMNLRDEKNIVNFVAAVRKFCGLVESCADNAENWIKRTLSALSDLYSCALHMPILNIDDVPEFDEGDYDVSDEEVRQISGNIGSLLQEQRYYWMCFEPAELPIDENEPVIGDIVDDLSDIYRDIKPGLNAWNTENDSIIPIIIFNWNFPNFQTHWGLHALSALRLLHHICFFSGLKKEC
jgi:hypothetical protein